MKNKNIKLNLSGIMTVACAMLLLGSGCKKFLDIPLPTNQVTSNGVYITDNATSAVVTGIFYNMYAESVYSGTESIGVRAAYYTDELTAIGTGNVFYTNSLASSNVSQWASFYRLMYQTNQAIEGIRTTSSTLNNKNQWLGESLFSRAHLYYYLVNLFGDVPLLLSSDVVVNNKIGRTPKAEVYAQIIADLKEAETLLGTDYKDGFALSTTNRGRPNKYAAAALLARVYLENNDWINAEAQSAMIIDNTATFQLVPPAQTFLATSKEMIWGLAPTGAGFVKEWGVYNNNMPAVLAGSATPTSYVGGIMSQSLVGLFDKTADTRFSNWVRTVTKTTPFAEYYLPDKYKSNVNGAEFVMVLRLAEQYLIRAEARVRQNKLMGASGGKADLDAVRLRANLTPSEAATQTDLIDAILKERQLELFTEFGFRFIDLKRTGRIDAVMGVVAPVKGGTWSSFKQIWPIRNEDILINRNLVQSPGYN